MTAVFRKSLCGCSVFGCNSVAKRCRGDGSGCLGIRFHPRVRQLCTQKRNRRPQKPPPNRRGESRPVKFHGFQRNRTEVLEPVWRLHTPYRKGVTSFERETPRVWSCQGLVPIRSPTWARNRSSVCSKAPPCVRATRRNSFAHPDEAGSLLLAQHIFLDREPVLPVQNPGEPLAATSHNRSPGIYAD